MDQPDISGGEPRPWNGGHVPALDSVRGLAILAVTVFRFGSIPGPDAAETTTFQTVTAFGARGVDLFFVLSGFLITGMLLDARGQPHYFRNFYFRRSLRIFPLYYGVLIGMLVILPAISASTAERLAAQERQGWLWLYGVNLWQAWTGTWPFGCLNHFWSLAVEEHFYFVWPLVIFLCDRRKAIWVCISVILIALVSRAAWLLNGGNAVAAEVFTLFRADQLAVGGLLAALVRHPGSLDWMKRRAPLFLTLGTVVIGAIAVSGRRGLGIPDTLYAFVFACLIVVMITARANSIPAVIGNSLILRTLGKYSYGMYVFQNPLIPATKSFLSIELLLAWTGNELASRILYVLSLTAATVFISAASWHLFECHFLMLKRFFPTRQAQLEAHARLSGDA